MEQSTTTLIQLVNIILLDVGDREVSPSSLNRNTVRDKCVNAITKAIHQVSALNDWEFARAIVPATSWNLDAATITNMHIIQGVSYLSTPQSTYKLVHLNRRDFDTLYTQSFSDAVGGSPQYYTKASSNVIRINPYPTGYAGQSKVLFYIYSRLLPPTSLTQFFNLPEYVVQTVVRPLATAFMYQAHIGDTAAANMAMSEYEQAVKNLRDTERNVPQGTLSMYKNRG